MYTVSIALFTPCAKMWVLWYDQYDPITICSRFVTSSRCIKMSLNPSFCVRIVTRSAGQITWQTFFQKSCEFIYFKTTTEAVSLWFDHPDVFTGDWWPDTMRAWPHPEVVRRIWSQSDHNVYFNLLRLSENVGIIRMWTRSRQKVHVSTRYKQGSMIGWSHMETN